MNTTHLLKAAYEKMPKDIKYALALVFIRAMIKNPEIRKTREELEHIEAYIRRRCEDLLDVTIRPVDEVQLTARGKFVWAVNTIEKKEA